MGLIAHLTNNIQLNSADTTTLYKKQSINSVRNFFVKYKNAL